MTIGLDTLTRNVMLDAITTRTGASAKLRIYNGVRPATSGAITTLLAELTCNATFAPGAAGAVLTLNAITANAAVASGTATWFRLFKSDGTTIILDGSVAQTTGGDLNLDSTVISSGAQVSVSSASLTAGNP